MLNEWLGQRKGDILSMSRQNHRDAAIFISQQKTGQDVALPVDKVPSLKQRLAAEYARQETRTVTATTIIVSEETGQPYTKFNFSHWVKKIADRAAMTRPALAGLQFQHLRHTAVTRLAEAGVSIAQIAAVTGHTEASIMTIISIYKIRTRKMAERAFDRRLEVEMAEQNKNK